MTTWIERVEHFAGAFWAAMGASAAGGVVWVIRTIFTNKKVAEAAQQSVADLRKEIEVREERRAEERETIDRIETKMDEGLKEVRADIKELFKRGD